MHRITETQLVSVSILWKWRPFKTTNVKLLSAHSAQ